MHMYAIFMGSVMVLVGTGVMNVGNMTLGLGLCRILGMVILIYPTID